MSGNTSARVVAAIVMDAASRGGHCVRATAGLADGVSVAEGSIPGQRGQYNRFDGRYCATAAHPRLI